MSSMITYEKIFRVTKCGLMIFFEDDFSFIDNKNNLIYSYSRLDGNMKNELLGDLAKIDAILTEKLKEYDDVFNMYVDVLDWNNEIIVNNIETAFEVINEKGDTDNYHKLQSIYSELDDILKPTVLPICNNYGLGVSVPKYFRPLFNEYILNEKRWKGFKIYQDFSNDTEKLFRVDLQKHIQQGHVITCFIDNQLVGGENEATNIINSIKELNKDIRHNIIGAVISSKSRNETFSLEFFAEYVDKKNKQELHKNIQRALTRSAYSLILNKLKHVYIETLNISFDDAIKNKNIAHYLSKMAAYEGATNYKVITAWVELLFSYKMNDNENILDIVRLTQLIDLMDEDEMEFNSEMLDLNTFEAFDYSVNRFYEPPSAGDIFSNSKGEYFILVGQDCDMMMSQTRTGNNAVMEFVKADIVEQTEITKLENDLQYMSVDNFRIAINEPYTKRLQVNYSSRIFIDNAIVKLCCFNSEGVCEISLDSILESAATDYMPKYMLEVYVHLQNFFKAFQSLYKNSPENVNLIFDSKMSPRYLSLNNFEESNDKMVYDLRRVCRMNRPYVLYLYKLFLEYRGRHPFDCINLTRHSNLEVEVEGHEGVFLPVSVILATNRNNNRKYIHKLNWIIKAKDLKNIIEETLMKSVSFTENITIEVNKNPFVVIDNDGAKIQIVKEKNNKISINII